jgi:hypothetical protein
MLLTPKEPRKTAMSSLTCQEAKLPATLTALCLIGLAGSLKHDLADLPRIL